MKLKIVGAAILAFMLAGAAHAVTVTSGFGAPDPGFGPDETLLVDFNGDLPAGFGLTGNFGYATNSSSAAAAPAGVISRYLYVSSAIPDGRATLTSAFDLASLSFYWGSIDPYNGVEILGAGGVSLLSLAGIDLPPANGGQSQPSTNRRVFFTAEAGEVITGIKFASTGVAFELDDIAGLAAGGGTAGAVPEPATWAMMLVGFGLIGAATRHKQFQVVTA